MFLSVHAFHRQFCDSLKRNKKLKYCKSVMDQQRKPCRYHHKCFYIYHRNTRKAIWSCYWCAAVVAFLGAWLDAVPPRVGCVLGLWRSCSYSMSIFAWIFSMSTVNYKRNIISFKEIANNTFLSLYILKIQFNELHMEMHSKYIDFPAYWSAIMNINFFFFLN